MRLVQLAQMLLLVASAAGLAHAQPQPQPQTQTPAAAPDYTPTLTFDVVSIRQTAGVTGGGLRVAVKSPPTSSTFEANNFTAKMLIQLAYGFGTPISGGPDWLGDVWYNVQAKSDPAVDEQLAKMPLDRERLEKQHMLQVMLTERFHLKYHMEDRESTVFALEPAKGGVKLHPIKLDPDAPPPSATGNDVQTRGGAQGLEFSVKSASPTAMTALLSSQLEEPVIDRTGLTGYFDFSLQIGRDWSAGNPQSWPDILTAVQEQLGLKLERTKATIPVLVIDHIDKPSAN
jgi:uncharacterized protein (TIGR03435 family)